MQVGDIEGKVRDAGAAVKTSLITLDTPGKASVDVVIVLDPVCVEAVCCIE